MRLAMAVSRFCSRVLKHDSEKLMPVFGKDHAQTIKHDPEKWMPVFGKDHAQTMS
jgi:hypothetical protein